MQRRDLPHDGSAPGVIYIHGGGQGQYAVPGWQGYSGAGTTYAANMMLAQTGYVVCIVDYRGSWNYGRDYETASYLDVGGGDLRDVVSATRWLGKQAQVDPGRIGVWGRSYGGFMTTLCMVKEPELYAAGVNLVGVFNWLDYYHYISDRAPGAWSRSRFELPDDHPELYRERNPLAYIDNLKAPYLALYGDDDANVPIDHCRQMVRALTEAGKDFELVIYPDEPHIFTRAATWRDALRRTVRHFDTHLCR
jgi:dipeptidyl aminopeptidase/acylaminoacyl peptidase